MIVYYRYWYYISDKSNIFQKLVRYVRHRQDQKSLHKEKKEKSLSISCKIPSQIKQLFMKLGWF